MSTPENRPVQPDEQALIDRLADVVAGAYVTGTPDIHALGEPVLGVLLPMYWDGADVMQVGPTAHAVTERTPERVPPGEPLWGLGSYHGAAIELAPVDVIGDPALHAPAEALLALIEEREAWDLNDDYFVTLTRRLAAAWGVPVAWDDYESGLEDYAADLIREQLDPTTAAAWEARGWLPRA